MIRYALGELQAVPRRYTILCPRRPRLQKMGRKGGGGVLEYENLNGLGLAPSLLYLAVLVHGDTILLIGCCYRPDSRRIGIGIFGRRKSVHTGYPRAVQTQPQVFSKTSGGFLAQ